MIYPPKIIVDDRIPPDEIWLIVPGQVGDLFFDKDGPLHVTWRTAPQVHRIVNIGKGDT